jgi:hypothetical protein
MRPLVWARAQQNERKTRLPKPGERVGERGWECVNGRGKRWRYSGKPRLATRPVNLTVWKPTNRLPFLTASLPFDMNAINLRAGTRAHMIPEESVCAQANTSQSEGNKRSGSAPVKSGNTGTAATGGMSLGN